MIIDFHCHLLPGLDDGAQNQEESLALARQCVEAGVTHVVATPHGSSHGLKDFLAKRDKVLADFIQLLKDQNIPLEVLPGLEYYADGQSAESAFAEPGCRCGKPEAANRPVLVELPFTIDISFAATLLFKSQLKGIPMVLAHPERYNGFLEHLPSLMELMDKGLFLQFNSDNFHKPLLFGRLGKSVMKLISHNPEQVLVGSDAHNAEMRGAGLTLACERITAELGEDAWKQISETTPASLLF